MIRQIGHYKIKDNIAQGRIAMLFHAFDTTHKRDVAIKLLSRQFLYHDITARARFQQEVKTIAALEHHAIVPVYALGIHNEQPYVVMRLMDDGSLADKIKEKSLQLAQIAPIFERIGAALLTVHDNGFVHGNLKPTNILFDPQGKPFLSDFGMGQWWEWVGKSAYRHPDNAKVDIQADVYALAVILREVLESVGDVGGKMPAFQAIIQHATETRYTHISNMLADITSATHGKTPSVFVTEKSSWKFRLKSLFSRA